MTHWSSYFDNFGVKTVTSTDKRKRAYVLTDEQCVAVVAAGNAPADTRPTPVLKVTILFDRHRSAVKSGFYHSVRSDEAARIPEPRMGKELISSWLQTNDEVVIANIGPKLFAFKLAEVPDNDKVIVDEIAKYN